ncbi:MAG: DUF3795 domain-containing protein [Bacteroidota bacterium]
MEKLISCCGLNCATCDARIATISNDDELKRQTAEKWRVQYHAPDITPEMINCTGCREPGNKFGHWAECGMRKCASSKGFNTCGQCDTLQSCDIIKPVLQFAPEAVENLKSVN